MAWICPMCSTANDPADSECMVCGHPKSETPVSDKPSWVCPLCSSVNEGLALTCTVCDTARPSETETAASGGVVTLTARRVRSLGLRGEVVVPEKYNVIGAEAFRGRTDITGITLHRGVRRIGKSAFEGCTNLRYIRSEGELDSISSFAFGGCTSLVEGRDIAARYVAVDAFFLPEGRTGSVSSSGSSTGRTSGGSSGSSTGRSSGSSFFAEVLRRHEAESGRGGTSLDRDSTIDRISSGDGSGGYSSHGGSTDTGDGDSTEYYRTVSKPHKIFRAIALVAFFLFATYNTLTFGGALAGWSLFPAIAIAVATAFSYTSLLRSIWVKGTKEEDSTVVYGYSMIGKSIGLLIPVTIVTLFLSNFAFLSLGALIPAAIFAIGQTHDCVVMHRMAPGIRSTARIMALIEYWLVTVAMAITFLGGIGVL